MIPPEFSARATLGEIFQAVRATDPPGAFKSPSTLTFAPDKAMDPDAGALSKMPLGTVILPSGLSTSRLENPVGPSKPEGSTT